MTDALPASLTIIFDGYCAMCTRTVEWLLAHDRDERLTIVPCQDPSGTDRFGVSRDQCEERVWAVTPEGQRKSGGQAVMLILAVLWQRSWPVTLGRLSVVSGMLTWGYEVITRNRHRLPGTTPWCTSHPEECLPARQAS